MECQNKYVDDCNSEDMFEIEVFDVLLSQPNAANSIRLTTLTDHIQI